MRMIRGIGARWRGGAAFRRSEDGAAIVEFVIILPMLALLTLASVETASYFWTRSRATDAATAVGDLTTQYAVVSDSSIATIFTAADAILSENAFTSATVNAFSVRLTSALACHCEAEEDVEDPRFCYTALWSHVHDLEGTRAGYEQGALLPETPDDIAVRENDTIIIAEMSYRYRPQIHFVFPADGIAVSETFYIRPRFSDRVVHVGSQALDIERRCDE